MTVSVMRGEDVCPRSCRARTIVTQSTDSMYL